VEGQVFHRGTVRELAGETDPAALGTSLVALVRKDMIRPDQPTFPDDEAYRFRHLLIRDAAYDALPKETRAELHERFADWLDRHAELVEQDEIVGYHLERAHRNRAELDTADPRLPELARRAAARLRSAALGARARGDHAATAGLLQRAVALLPEGDPERLDALILLTDPNTSGVIVSHGREMAAELARSPDPRYQAYAVMVGLWTDAWINEWQEERAVPLAAAAAAVFREHGDELGLAWVERHEWYRHWVAMRLGAAGAAAARGEQHARAAGDTTLADDLRRRSRSYHYDLTPIDAAVVTKAEALVGESTGIVSRAILRRQLAKLLAIQGEFDAARKHVSQSIAELREAGQPLEAGAASMYVGFIEVRAGDLEAAERALEAGALELERLGSFGFYTTVALQLAEVLIRRGRLDEAARWSTAARARVAEDDLVDVVSRDALEGFLAASRGDHAEAERRARHAVEVAAPIEAFEPKAAAQEWLGQTLALAGRTSEAREAAAAALAVYEAKRDVAAIAWTRALLDSLSASAPR
jgi:hypothetical protein